MYVKFTNILKGTAMYLKHTYIVHTQIQVAKHLPTPAAHSTHSTPTPAPHSTHPTPTPHHTAHPNILSQHHLLHIPHPTQTPLAAHSTPYPNTTCCTFHTVTFGAAPNTVDTLTRARTPATVSTVPHRIVARKRTS